MKKEHPILFSTPMVQAILEGRKTMTRRIKGLEMPNHDHYGTLLGAWGLSKHLGVTDGVSKWNIQTDVDDYKTVDIKCPYGKIGDILWVRETWAPKSISEEPPGDKAHYKATDSLAADKWHPSIFMPRAACRILLEITDIKVERVQDIREEDALREGIRISETEGYQMSWNYIDEQYWLYDPKKSFKTLWQSINGEESWNQNPWVWVIQFEKSKSIF